jgi:hypothetical protein
MSESYDGNDLSIHGDYLSLRQVDTNFSAFYGGFSLLEIFGLELIYSLHSKTSTLRFVTLFACDCSMLLVSVACDCSFEYLSIVDNSVSEYISTIAISSTTFDHCLFCRNSNTYFDSWEEGSVYSLRFCVFVDFGVPYISFNNGLTGNVGFAAAPLEIVPQFNADYVILSATGHQEWPPIPLYITEPLTAPPTNEEAPSTESSGPNVGVILGSVMGGSIIPIVLILTFCGNGQKEEVENVDQKGNPSPPNVVVTQNVEESPRADPFVLETEESQKVVEKVTELVLTDKKRYIKGEILGSSGSGLVLKYQDQSANTVMAVKVFHRTADFNSEAFLKEAGIFAAISHPCILRIIGVTLPSERSGPRIALELMPNGSVADILEKVANGETPEFWTHTTIAKIIIGTILGLIHVHGRGIIHGHLKPGNLLIGPDGRVRVGGFGSARLCEVQQIIYAAPELLTGTKQSTKTDMYSFGLILYEIMFLQKVVSPTLAMAEITSDILSVARRPVIPGVTEPDRCPVNPIVRNIIRRCWSVNPIERPSFTSILGELRMSGFPFYPDVDAAEVSAYLADITAHVPPDS